MNVPSKTIVAEFNVPIRAVHLMDAVTRLDVGDMYYYGRNAAILYRSSDGVVIGQFNALNCEIK